jgi:hypothetical protein
MEAVELCYCFTSVFNELFMAKKVNLKLCNLLYYGEKSKHYNLQFKFHKR